MKYFFYFELKCSLLPNDLGVIGCHWQGKEDWTDVLRLFWAILVYIWHENIKTRSNQNAFDVWKFDHWGFFIVSGNLDHSREVVEVLQKVFPDKQIIYALGNHESFPCNRYSVTRWSYYLFIFGHWQQWKLAHSHKRIAKVGSKFCQILNKPLQNWPRLLKYCQSCEISPNLVTLNRYHLRIALLAGI